MKNFHAQPFEEKIKPLALFLNPTMGYECKVLYVKVKAENLRTTLDYMKSKWEEIAPAYTFRHSFLDADLARAYQDIERWELIIRYSAIFAQIIACLGAFGLIVLAVNLRTKELGIHKILGASVTGIITLLSKEFIKLVIIANLIAWTMSWFALKYWLQNFVYRINLGYGMFLITGFITIALVMITIGYHAVRAAIANPVEALRYE